ncbi:hypothetical protein EGO58_11815, partial [Limosilactobacillus reuteri]
MGQTPLPQPPETFSQSGAPGDPPMTTLLDPPPVITPGDVATIIQQSQQAFQQQMLQQQQAFMAAIQQQLDLSQTGQPPRILTPQDPPVGSGTGPQVGGTPPILPLSTPLYMVPPPYPYHPAYAPNYPSTNSTIRVVESFKRYLPLVFSKVGSDPLEPDQWIQELEKIFEVLECTDAQKLICAGLQLKKEANSWWQAS